MPKFLFSYRVPKGYSVVTAQDMEGAAAMAEGCPALQLGGGVEIGAVPEITESLPGRG